MDEQLNLIKQMKTCKLVSCISSVPDLIVKEGDVLEIGRNRQCQIKDRNCGRRHVDVQLKCDQQRSVLSAHYNQLKTTRIYENGAHLTGPGFKYLITINDNSDNQEDEDEDANVERNQEKRQIKRKTTKDKMDSVSKILKESSHSEGHDQEITWDLSDDKFYYGKYLGGGPGSSKIAAFDFDGTLSLAKSGSKFPVDGKDFKLIDKRLPQLIKKFVDDGYKFVIFSNQMGISRGHTKLNHVQGRIEGILRLIGSIPCFIMLAHLDNLYRKPRPGFIYAFEKHFNNGIAIDKKNSFYVGDAAGRISAGKKDHSADDLLFAINNQIPFITPENFSVGKKPVLISQIPLNTKCSSFDPKSIKNLKQPIARLIPKINLKASDYTTENDLIEELIKLSQSKKLFIIFVGLAASGKSSFYQRYLNENPNFVRINRDELGTQAKCEKEAETVMKQKLLNVVIDNTNVDIATRSKWLKFSKTYDYSAIAINFKTEVAHTIHNNTFRRLIHELDDKPSQPTKSVPIIAIRSQNKNFVEPQYSEGFDYIFIVNFMAHFNKKDDENLYWMYL